MSQSYPSSSWEPYGSSQQQHALGWRPPATKPARPSPPSRFPALARWNHFHAPQRTDPLPFSKPSSNPCDPHTVSAALQQHERDSRSLERYNTLRTGISALETQLQKLVDTVDDERNSNRERHVTLASHIEKIQAGCLQLRDEIRENISRLDARLSSSIQKVVSNSVEGTVRRVVTATLSEWEHVIVSAASQLKRDTPRAVRPEANASGRRAGVQQNARGLTRRLCRSSAASQRPNSAPRTVTQTHSSDDEYALRVAYRGKHGSSLRSPYSSSYVDGNHDDENKDGNGDGDNEDEDIDSLELWMASQDAGKSSRKRACTRLRAGGRLHSSEKDDTLSESLPLEKNQVMSNARCRPLQSTSSSSSSSSSSWLPGRRCDERRRRGEKRSSAARKNGRGGCRSTRKVQTRRPSMHTQRECGKKRKRSGELVPLMR